MSISATVRQCLGKFKNVEGEHPDLPGLEDEHGRFRTWVGNISAHRSGGRRSLEYRLRDSSNLQSMVVSLLQDILKALDDLEAVAKIRIGDTGDNSLIAPEQESGQDEDDSDEEDDAKLFGIADDDGSKNDPVVRTLSEIREINLCLLRFSMTLRNPARHDQMKESASTSTHYFERWDIDHVRHKFLEAQPYLHERLGKAISKHRQYFKYREEHHSKLAEGLDDEKEAKNERPSTIATSLNAPDLPDSTISKGDELETESLYTATSFAPTTAGGETTLRPPPLPEAGQGGAPFECPLCFSIVIAEDERSWRQHVYEDLPPYVCTYSECITANQRYTRRRDWQRHQASIHNRHWLCPYGCSALDSEAGFKQHLVKKHGHNNDEITQKRLMESCAVASSDVTDLTCPLCQKLLTSSKLWMKHVGHHLEQLALHAIPQHVFASESDKESVATGQSDRSSASSDVRDEFDAEDDRIESLLRQDHAQGDAVQEAAQVITLKDAVGRKFVFPWDRCKIWADMESLIKEAFRDIDVLEEQVHDGHYDLVGSDGEVILPQVWHIVVRPGWDITMHMWPLEESKKTYLRRFFQRRGYPDDQIESMIDREGPKKWYDALAQRARQDGQSEFQSGSEYMPSINESPLEENIADDIDFNETERFREELSDRSSRTERSLNRSETSAHIEQEASGKDETSSDQFTTIIRGREVDITHLDLDPDYLETLPEDLREEVVMQQLAEMRAQAVRSGEQPNQISKDFLDALPPDIQRELLRQEEVDRRRQQQREGNTQRAAETGTIDQFAEHQPQVVGSVAEQDHRLQTTEDGSGQSQLRGSADHSSANPAHTRIHRNLLEEATLKHFAIPWDVDQSDGNYFILHLDLDPGEREPLFEHTRQLRGQKRAPIFPKIHRDYLDEATLKYYSIPYETDRNDNNYFILLREMEKAETDALFEHTNKLRDTNLFDEGNRLNSHERQDLTAERQRLLQRERERVKQEREREWNPFLEKQQQKEDEEEEPLSQDMRDRLTDAGVGDDQIEAVIEDRLKGKEASTQAHGPVYSKVHVKYLSLETLRYYGIPWEFDAEDDNYIIINREHDKYEMEVLFEHTKKLRQPNESGGPLGHMRLNTNVKSHLTKEQHDILETHFAKQTKPSTKTKKEFAELLNVSLDKVNNWFQNRRAKAKQDAKKSYGLSPTVDTDPTSVELSLPPSHTTQNLGSIPESPLRGTEESSAEDWRSVIDDLTEENKRLKQSLKEYEKSRNSQSSHERKLVTEEQTKQLQETLGRFATSIKQKPNDLDSEERAERGKRNDSEIDA